MVVLVPLKVFAVYVCECNSGMTKGYDTQEDCRNPMLANSCVNFCTSNAGIATDCIFIDNYTEELPIDPFDYSGTGVDPTNDINTVDASEDDDEPERYESAELDNPLAGNETSIPNLIARVIKIILGLIGVASLIMFIYAGFMWLTAQGNMEKIKKGRDTMLYAVIGLVIVFSSYIVLNYLFGILTF